MALSIQAQQKRASCTKAWVAEHPEMVLAYRRKWNAANKAAKRRWAESNKESVRASRKRYKEKARFLDPQGWSAKGRVYEKRRRERRKLDPAASAAAREYWAAKWRLKRAAWLEEQLRRQQWRCPRCACDLRRTPFHIDHIIPRAKGGSNESHNLWVLCQPCNYAKADNMEYLL